MRLYKIIQGCWDEQTTQEILADLSDQFSDDHSSKSGNSSRKQSSLSESSNVERLLQHRLQVLLYLSSHSILNGALRKMHFTVVLKCSKLIREACNSLYEYCRQQSCPVSIDDQNDLALRLYKLAPKSLGDPDEYPEVIFMQNSIGLLNIACLLTYQFRRAYTGIL